MTIGSRTGCDCVVTETSVQTCQRCLPAGAITWLIEHGRQVDLFEEGGVTPRERGRAELERISQSDTDAVLGRTRGWLPFS